MTYLVLARKYRPKTFAEVAGQPATARTLENAIKLDRIAHAYLFAGPRGVGKTSMARILARSLCCESGPTPEPCGTCGRCLSILKGNDLDVVEIDAASNRGIDDIRALRDKARVAPMRGKTKFYIIDEVHQLTSEAFNALLKLLEEPPEHVMFVLATTEPERLPDTIRSRCQFFEFRRVPDAEIAARLKEVCALEKVKAEDGAFLAIARAAKGGMRDAQSILDQAITHGGGKVTAEGVAAVTGSLSSDIVRTLFTACVDGDLSRLLHEVDTLDRAGVAAESVVDALLSRARDLLVLTATNDAEGLVDDAADWADLAKKLDVDRVLAMTNLLLQARRRVKEHDEPRLPLEAALLRMARLAETVGISDAIAMLKSMPTGPAPARAAAPPRPPERRAPPPPASTSSPGPAARTPSRPSAPPPKSSPPKSPPPKSSAPATPAAGAARDTPASEPARAPAATPTDAAGAFVQLVDAVRTQSGSVAAWLNGFTPTAFDGEAFDLTSPARPSPVYDLNSPKVRSVLEEASQRVFGRSITLRPSGRAAAGGSTDAVVDRAREMFDGEVI